MMTWKEFKDTVDKCLHDSGISDNVVIDYIDFSGWSDYLSIRGNTTLLIEGSYSPECDCENVNKTNSIKSGVTLENYPPSFGAETGFDKK